MRYKREDPPDVGITVDCVSCDTLADKHLNENLEVAHHEKTGDKVVIGGGLLNAGYTQTDINRDGHRVIGHQVNADLGIPGVLAYDITAGHKQEASFNENGFHLGTNAHLGVGSPNDQVQINANAHVEHSIYDYDVPVGVKVGASLNADAAYHITDDVEVGVGVGIGLGGQVGYSHKDRNAGIEAITPVGTYGFKFGCKNSICFVACVSVNVC